jgi:hypothetical protein
VNINSKRGGPKHRVRNSLDDYPWINDWFEALIVGVALIGIGGGALGLYYLSTQV